MLDFGVSVTHLFNSAGEWIAFRNGKYVFDPEGEWIGWLPWDDDDIVTIDGEYLGTIAHGNRIYKLWSRPYRGYPGYPGFPGYPGYPGYPGFAGYDPLPPLAEDVELRVSR